MAWTFRSPASRTWRTGEDNAFLKEGLARINALVEQAMSGFSAAHPGKDRAGAGRRTEANQRAGRAGFASSLSEQAQVRRAARARAEAGAVPAAPSCWRWDFRSTPSSAPSRSPLAAAVASSTTGRTESFAYAVPGQEFAVTRAPE